MTCNVVFNVKYSFESKTLDKKTYRGTYVTLNWNSGDDEIQKCFDNALKDALQKVLKDANTISRVFNAQSSL